MSCTFCFPLTVWVWFLSTMGLWLGSDPSTSSLTSSFHLITHVITRVTLSPHALPCRHLLISALGSSGVGPPHPYPPGWGGFKWVMDLPGKVYNHGIIRVQEIDPPGWGISLIYPPLDPPSPIPPLYYNCFCLLLTITVCDLSERWSLNELLLY